MVCGDCAGAIYRRMRYKEDMDVVCRLVMTQDRMLATRMFYLRKYDQLAGIDDIEWKKLAKIRCIILREYAVYVTHERGC
jgi:hypothetical protein